MKKYWLKISLNTKNDLKKYFYIIYIMSSTNYFNIAAIKVFTDLYEFIKVDEMLQEYEPNYIESNNNVIESKPKKQKNKLMKIIKIWSQYYY
jgi:hypothetical protein